MFCYAQAFIAQIEQSVACNAIHTNEERAARWLLMSCDRAEFAAAFLITIADRRGQEELACECYQIVREEYDACFSRAQTANSFRSEAPLL